MSGVIMPKAFLSPVQTRKNIHLIAFYKFPNVNNENPLDADIMKVSVLKLRAKLWLLMRAGFADTV